jgi:hypothetical protein
MTWKNCKLVEMHTHPEGFAVSLFTSHPFDALRLLGAGLSPLILHRTPIVFVPGVPGVDGVIPV